MILSDELATLAFAKLLAATINGGDLLLLKGDLGAGKTLIAREVIRYYCGKNTNVISPTFNLVQTYQTAANFMIYHYDLYRLKSPMEIYELGIEEALNNNLCIIEWPEIIESLLPKPYIKIDLEIVGNKRLCRKTIVVD